MNTLLALAVLGVGNPPAAALHCPATDAAKGDVKAGPPLTHAFELTHRGAGTLTVTTVETGCGCLRRTLSATVLKPGETARLAVEVNTLTQPDGPNRWQLAVGYTLDPPAAGDPGRLLLAVAATLSRDVTVAPPQVGFSCTGAATQAITVTDRRAKPLTIVRAVASAPHLTAEVGPATATPAGRVQTVALRLAADAPVGHRDESVVLLTDDPAYPEFRVPVRVLKRAAAAVVATPDAVRFAPGQVEVSELIQLRTPDGKPVGVAAAECDHPGVMLKWSAGVGAVAAVRVTLPAATAARAGEGVVRVRLAEPAGQEVTIPVSWKGAAGK